MSYSASKIIPSIIQSRPKLTTVLWENRTVIIAVVVGTVAVVAGVAACLIFIPGAPLAAFGAIAVGALFGKLGLGSFIAASAGLGALSVIGTSGLAALPVLICRCRNKSKLLNTMREKLIPTKLFLKCLAGPEESKKKLYNEIFSTIELYIKFFKSKQINDDDIITLLLVALDPNDSKDFPELFTNDPQFQQVVYHWEDCQNLRKTLFDLVNINFIDNDKHCYYLGGDSSLKSAPLVMFLLETFPSYIKKTEKICYRLSMIVSQVPYIRKQCGNDEKLKALVFKNLSTKLAPSEETISSLIDWIKYLGFKYPNIFTKNPMKCCRILECIQDLEIKQKDQKSIDKLKKIIDILFKHKEINENDILHPLVFQYISSEIEPSVESLSLLICSIRLINSNDPNPFENKPDLCKNILDGIQRNPNIKIKALPNIIETLLK